MMGRDSYSSAQFPVPNAAVYDHYYDHHHYFDSSPSVDCTLSLGTPSTRLVSTEEDEMGSFSSEASYHHHHNVSPGSFAWDPYGSNQMTRGRRGSGGNASNGGDSLLARRCANCDTTTTPLWRNGPRGPKSLCNACGIRYKKEERRANAANGTGGHRKPCYSQAATNEFMFIDDVSDGDFLSWRFGGGDRAGLVHDFNI